MSVKSIIIASIFLLHTSSSADRACIFCLRLSAPLVDKISIANELTRCVRVGVDGSLFHPTLKPGGFTVHNLYILKWSVIPGATVMNVSQRMLSWVFCVSRTFEVSSHIHDCGPGHDIWLKNVDPGLNRRWKRLYICSLKSALIRDGGWHQLSHIWVRLLVLLASPTSGAYSPKQ